MTDVKLSPVLRSAAPGHLSFLCPGCDMPHAIRHGEGAEPRWEWNGNVERPTFRPSVLVRWTQWEPPCTTLEMAARIDCGEIVQTQVDKICHSFVTDGFIQFLHDCTHALAGQTVELANWDISDWS